MIAGGRRYEDAGHGGMADETGWWVAWRAWANSGMRHRRYTDQQPVEPAREIR